MKLRALMLLSLCFAVPAQAGLFSDDEARKQVQEVEARVLKLEEINKQQTQSMLDLQGQIDAQNGEIRKLRGQNEELTHGLQDAEKREKDFYVDLDTRLRHFESADGNAPAAVSAEPVVAEPVVIKVKPEDLASENRAIETAYGLSNSGDYTNAVVAFEQFISKYPDSVHVSNARYWLGNAQFALQDYKAALATYRELLKVAPYTPKAPDVLFNIAGCQQELKAVNNAQATLKQLIAKYPDSAAAAKAKNLLTVVK